MYVKCFLFYIMYMYHSIVLSEFTKLNKKGTFSVKFKLFIAKLWIKIS